MAVDQASLSAQLTAAITAVNAAISTVGALQDSSPVVLQTIYAAVQGNRAVFDSAIAMLDADIDTTSVGGVVPGVPAPVLAMALLNQQYDVSHQAVAIIAEAYVTRAGINVFNSPG